MRILFWGTPAYAVPTLEALLAAGHTVVGVVSQPDRRRGRGSSLAASPVKTAALERGLPVFTPQRISRDAACQQQLAALNAEAFVVVAFGQLLPPSVLAMPPLGCWNGHGSLLPRWRGAAPIQWSLLSGDQETGVGVMAMDPGLDTGPVLLERRLSIGLLDNASHLRERLSQLTAELMVEAMPLISTAGSGSEAERRARLGVRHQDDALATKARLLTKEDSRIDWQEPALVLHRRVMALHPGAWTLCSGRRLKLLASEPLLPEALGALSPEAAALVNDASSSGRDPAGAALGGVPGTVEQLLPALGPVVRTGAGRVLLREAQLEGKRPASGATLIQQLKLASGDQLGGD
ncbi:methionyl-tRNA formyltransferase [Synechococcus sp. RSCCF101]|uniref:methionyl-tRNA formyltransferase n=1 Tax=Synechococcus sp. RSCCF101 TaxID=2511069 RepID=UPI001248F8D2|nr:methionyl-tRNA formyltransferase [Synechococcus sp. RSCCF101]QEY31772.1 methionyl-tRNA formyltransferase [Synechococcus sp. RSCCF101]